MVAAVVVVHGVRDVGWGIDVMDGERGQGVHAFGEGFGPEAIGEGGDAADPGGCGEGVVDLEEVMLARRSLGVDVACMELGRMEEKRERRNWGRVA